MSSADLLFVEFAIAFYNVGTIWAHELDIFRTWRLIDDPASFKRVQTVHWHKLPYWVFTPVALQLLVSVALVFDHPERSPAWAVWISPSAQLASLALTGAFWGRWQAKLSRDPRGADSRWLTRILQTHWVRTLLINVAGFAMLGWVIQIYG